MIVARDSDTGVVRRLVAMSRAVYNCKRMEVETYSMFTNRFRGLAQAYLNQTDSSNTQLEDQNFAMVLLENARLEESTFNNIISIFGSKGGEAK